MKNSTSIIPVLPGECQSKSWKNILKSAISSPDKLLQIVGVKPENLPFALDTRPQFAIRVPLPFIAKMRYGDANDPLLLQVLSTQIENQVVAGYTQDPLAENTQGTEGWLHKYHGRVLLILASACAVNCRYCFRRHFPYQEKSAVGEQLAESLDYIRQSTSISEVILSGGDPLMLTDQSLQKVINDIESIGHIRRLRIHTRLPVVIPQRITEPLCQLLQKTRLDCSVVLHINHPQEIDESLADALAKLRRAGVTLLNQSVLLNGINDQSEILIALSESLFHAGVIPYYIHLLDRISGAAHFDVAPDRALNIISDLRRNLPGYLVPRLAREDSGTTAKTILA